MSVLLLVAISRCLVCCRPAAVRASNLSLAAHFNMCRKPAALSPKCLRGVQSHQGSSTPLHGGYSWLLGSSDCKLYFKKFSRGFVLRSFIPCLLRRPFPPGALSPSPTATLGSWGVCRAGASAVCRPRLACCPPPIAAPTPSVVRPRLAYFSVPPSSGESSDDDAPSYGPIGAWVGWGGS